MMQAHRIPPCGGSCATCRRSARRDRLLAALVIVVFVAVFVIPAVWRTVTW